MQNENLNQRLKENPALISDNTANILILIIVVLFLVGLYLVPSGKVEDKENKDFAKGKKKEEAEDSRFAVPKSGGVLQNMQKDNDGNIKLKLTKKIKVSDDTFIFRFGFPQEDAVLGLPIGKHVVFTANILNKDGKEEETTRKYTPIS